MGIYRGPGVVNDGLVFGYDTGYPISDNATNNRFNQGQPATNNTIAANYSWNGDGSNQSFANKGVVEVTGESLKYNGYDTYLWTPGSSLNCYLNGSPELNYSDPSTVWTFSCYVKRDDGAAITSLNVYMYYPSSDGSASGTIVDCGNGWYRVSRTRTGSNEEIQLAGFTSFAAGHKYYLSGVMLTKTNHTVPHIQIQSSRSDTASLIDLKRTTSIDVGDVSFDSNAQPTFDGTDDFLTVPSYSGFTVDTRTVEIIFKMNGSYSNFSPLAVYANGSSSSNRIWLGLQNSRFQMHGWGTVDPSGTTTIAVDTWYVCTFSYNKSTQAMKMYTNGVLESTTTNTQGGVTAVSGMNWYLATIPGGWQSVTYSDVDIPSFKIYDRILSDAEVAQNFNSYKNRFNI